ncbi:MAG TPA: restriction endonuclease [Chloroflexia bacterium]|nr:restriction endonuclease [Chloroflexia bacterium]
MSQTRAMLGLTGLALLLLLGVAAAQGGGGFVAALAGIVVLGAVALNAERLRAFTGRPPSGGKAGRARASTRRVPVAREVRVPVPRAPVTTLAALQALTPAQFEEFTRLLFEGSGLYRNVQRTGKSGDQGIDLQMWDGAGNLCIVQCKRYQGTVAPSAVRDLYGVMVRNGAREGFFVTTGKVSSPTKRWSPEGHRLHVWDRDELEIYARRYLGERLEETIRRVQQPDAGRA